MAVLWISCVLLVIVQSCIGQDNFNVWICDKESLDRCIADGNLEQRNFDDLGKAIIPDISDTELDRVCADQQGMFSCLTAVNNDCEQLNETAVKNEVTRTIEELSVGREFMCSGRHWETYTEYVRPCLEEKREDLEKAGSKCLGEYYNGTWFLDRSDSINGYRYCTSAQQYLTCQRDAVKKYCGDTVGSWAMGYHRALWHPHMTSIKCSLDEGMEVGAIVIIALCVGAATYCIFFVSLGLARDSPKCKCDGLRKHTRPGYKYQLQKQEHE